MDKINFVNNSEPDLSAENLNLLQTNVENAIISKKQVTIKNGTLKNGDSLDIAVEFKKYEKLILEIAGSTMVEGASYILEIDDNGALVNRGVNFYNYTNDSYMCSGFFYQSGRNNMKLVMRKAKGWSSKNYFIKGILRK